MFSLTRKKLIVCVRPGVELVRANPRELVSAFSKLDLPMFERPQKATSGRLSWGKSSGCFALLTNRAELILTTHSAKGYGTNRTTFIVTRDCLPQKEF
jgi:hypothetical protein